MMVPTSSAVLMSTLCFIGYNVVKGDAKTSLDVRRLQTNQTLNFRATYKADFQHLRDIICMAEPPVLQVSCRGKLTILGVSDSSIFCVEMDEPIFTNGTSYQCTNLCSSTGTACTSVYETSVYGDLDGPFGSIEFMCEGNEILQVDAQYTYLAGNDGSCMSSDSTTITRNFHLGRLGVYCPTGSTGNRAYVYDDTYVECRFVGTASVALVDDIVMGNEEDIYVCYSGDNCDGLSCSVPFDDILFLATLPEFLNSCVDRIIDVPAIPTAAPQASTSSIDYIAQFEASWAQLFQPVSSQVPCSGANPSVLISCGAGTSIEFLNSTDSAMLCNPVSSSELLCLGDPNAITDTFVSVNYTCAGSNIPVSKVTYPDASASCTGNTVDVAVSHEVTLGVVCDSSGLFVYYGDLAFECAEAGHNFDYAGTRDGYEFELLRYICRESVIFGVGSTSPQTIRNVTITTDETWLSIVEGCVNVVASPTVPTAPVASPPTPPPTNSVTPLPTQTLSLSPTTTPTMGPIAVTESPSMKPVVTTVAPIAGGVTGSTTAPVVSSGGSGSSIVGIAIGSAVGGVALATVVAFFLLFSKRKQAGSSSNSASKPTNESHYTESNTNDDFTSSSRPPTTPQDYMGYSATAALVQPSRVSQPQPLPLYPVTEVPSNNNNRYANNEVIEPNNKREVFVPPPDMPMPAVRKSITRQSATSSSSSHRSSYPTNHVVNVKDQCRSVAMVRSSSPTFVSPTVDTSTTIPFAVALGVSTTTMQQPSVTSSTSSRTSKKEPAGRILDDY